MVLVLNFCRRSAVPVSSMAAQLLQRFRVSKCVHVLTPDVCNAVPDIGAFVVCPSIVDLCLQYLHLWYLYPKCQPSAIMALSRAARQRGGRGRGECCGGEMGFLQWCVNVDTSEEDG